nr:MAG TPA: hypothetical protein [Caudoviricetes sp.]
MNKLSMLKLEDRNTVRDNLSAIVERIHDYIADKYLEGKVDIEITNITVVDFGINGIDFRALAGNLDLVYGALLEAGYRTELFSDEDTTWIKVSV